MSRKTPIPTDCPCGSGRDYSDCCSPYHQERSHPPTAEALMRSRFSAYVLKNSAYLRYSWHPDTCPEGLDLDDEPVKWLGLAIVSTRLGSESDDEGYVEFVARYKLGGRAARMTELSRFTRYQGRWVYLDGVVGE